MSLTFETLIEHNRFYSKLLIIAMITVIALLVAVVGVVLTSPPEMEIARVSLVGGLVGAGIAGIGALVSLYAGSWMVAQLAGGRKLDRGEDPVLFNVVEEMAIAAGIPAPAIYVLDDMSPNAFAAGRDPEHAIVGITAGLRSKLSRDELQAVIAHEIAHIRNYDTRLMMLVAIYAGIIVVLGDLLWRISLDRHSPRLASRRSRGSGKSAGPLIIVALLFAVFLSLFAPAIAKLLQLAVSREREYLADATAVKFCRNPGALARALQKISLDKDPFDSPNHALDHMYVINPLRRLSRANDDTAWSTHPPVIKRIAKLRRLAGDMGLTFEEQP